MFDQTFLLLLSLIFARTKLPQTSLWTSRLANILLMSKVIYNSFSFFSFETFFVALFGDVFRRIEFVPFKSVWIKSQKLLRRSSAIFCPALMSGYGLIVVSDIEVDRQWNIFEHENENIFVQNIVYYFPSDSNAFVSLKKIVYEDASLNSYQNIKIFVSLLEGFQV